jgi:hypothetical protein
MFWAAIFVLTFFHFLAAVAARSTAIANIQLRSWVQFDSFPQVVTPGETYQIVFSRSDDTTVSISVILKIGVY